MKKIIKKVTSKLPTIVLLGILHDRFIKGLEELGKAAHWAIFH